MHVELGEAEPCYQQRRTRKLEEAMLWISQVRGEVVVELVSSGGEVRQLRRPRSPRTMLWFKIDLGRQAARHPLPVPAARGYMVGSAFLSVQVFPRRQLQCLARREAQINNEMEGHEQQT